MSSPHELVRAEELNKPAIPPEPRTINLTQEQRFTIKGERKGPGFTQGAEGRAGNGRRFGAAEH